MTPDSPPGRVAPRKPDARAFALIGTGEAATRAVLLSVLPVSALAFLGDPQSLSAAYLIAGVAGLALSLVMPMIARRTPRRWIFRGGAVAFLATCVAGAAGGWGSVAAIFLAAAGAVMTGIAYNAYLMDYVPRAELARAESLRLFLSAAAWTAGPFLGVFLMATVHPTAPYVASALGAVVMLALFAALGFGNGRAIRRAKPAPAVSLRHLGAFLRRPRLVGGWALATARSCGWVAFFVYVPVFALDAGLGKLVAGFIVSVGQAYLFAAPLMRRWMARVGVRRAVVVGFAGGSASWAAAAAFADGAPVVAAGALLAAGFFMVLLDVAASLPFLMAVKPSERTEMSSIFATFRDASNIVTPAIGAAVLWVAPLPAVFLTVALGYAISAAAARALPRGLGRPRSVRAPFPAVRPVAQPAPAE